MLSRPVLPCLSLVLTALLPVAGAQEVVTDFDDVSAPPAFKFIEPGFANGPHIERPGVVLDGGVILIDLLFDSAATTGDNILASCDTCSLGNGSGLPGLIRAVFDAPQDRVELDVINGVGFGSASFTLSAQDGTGTEIASHTITVGPAGSPTSSGHLRVEAPGITRVFLTTALPTGYTFAMDTLVATTFTSVFADLGNGLAGSAGTPALTGFGSLVGGDEVLFEVAGGLAGAPAFFVLGLSQVDAPFKQGVLVPAPDVVLPLPPLDGAGALALPLPFPPGVPASTTFTTQIWIVDAGGPAGFAASNGLSGTTPPGP